MIERTDLVTRLEAAETGSRRLDFLIAQAIDPGNSAHWEGQFKRIWATKEDKIDDIGLPHHTTSIDAALTLVPEGWSGYLAFETPSPGSDTVASARLFYTAEDPKYYGVAATPALALAIAAMKALQL